MRRLFGGIFIIQFNFPMIANLGNYSKIAWGGIFIIQFNFPMIAKIGNMQAFLISQHLLPLRGEKGLFENIFILDSI